MKLNLLNKEELTNLYKDEMMFDFPRAELKPLRAMLRLMDMGQYDPLLVDVYKRQGQSRARISVMG